jgi:hypothetical protein
VAKILNAAFHRQGVAAARLDKKVADTRDKPKNPKKETKRAALKPPAPGLQREQLEYYLGHLAQYDVLTELPNRS